MTNKLPTVDIKGKEYVMVKDRIMAFHELYPDGSIVPELISPYDSPLIVMKATVKPSQDSTRAFVGHSQATIGDGYINKTSALENCETSAVGRALALLGIGIIDSIASVDEINKTTHYQKPQESKEVKNFLQDLEPTDEEIIKWQEHIDMCRDLTELKRIWKEMPIHVQPKLEKYKNDAKFKLS